MDKIITGALKEKKLDDLLDSLSDLRSQTDNNKNIHKKIDQSIARIIDEYVIPNPPEEIEYDTLKDIYLKLEKSLI